MNSPRRELRTRSRLAWSWPERTYSVSCADSPAALLRQHARQRNGRYHHGGGDQRGQCKRGNRGAATRGAQHGLVEGIADHGENRRPHDGRQERREHRVELVEQEEERREEEDGEHLLARHAEPANPPAASGPGPRQRGRDARRIARGRFGSLIHRDASRARDRHAADLERRGGDTASKREIVADHLDVAQHVEHVARDGDLLDRVGDASRARSRARRRRASSRR